MPRGIPNNPHHLPPTEQSTEDMSSWIELLGNMQQQLTTLTEEQSKLTAENKLLNAKIVDAATQSALHKPVSATSGVVGDRSLMSRDRITAFLNSRRPDTEFFILKNPYYKFQLDAGKPAPYSIEQQRETGRPIPGFWLVMQMWFGPGCELRKADGSQKYKIGSFDITKDTLLKITKEDIAKYHLAVGEDATGIIEPRPDGIYDISTLLARIYNDDDYKLGRLLTGEAFRAVMLAEYENLWSTQQNQEKLAARLASLRSGAEKTGILAEESIDRLTGMVGIEPSKSGSNIVEPVMS